MGDDQKQIGCPGTVIVSVRDQAGKDYAVGVVFAESDTIEEVRQRVDRVLRTAHLRFVNQATTRAEDAT